jgi:Ca2+-binding RTX toxin-like protein
MFRRRRDADDEEVDGPEDVDGEDSAHGVDVVLEGGKGRDKLYGGPGDDELYGGKGRDKLYGGSGDDELYGGKGRDKLYGGPGDDELYGGRGNDKLYGGKGDDTLRGGQGGDVISGGANDDILDGGVGDDFLQGGAGADVFFFDFGGGQAAPGNDVVRDFNAGAGDVLRFANVLHGDFEGAIVGIDDDGRDVTILFEVGSVMLDGLGTGAINTVAALLNEFGVASVEMVA